ncbi:DegT/DnrJ/EryC1/StrS family aminotransferase [Actinophytocola glycyrrhizae]|uniref:DegT/DnrJ/EryC1/StrS family aminotransferase n=1 Tax=Actinophytocola glycyrrhizae TaxID=2044873 RepID=A0ABV9RXA4_9PSEU
MVDVPDPLFGPLEMAAVSQVLSSGQLWRGNGAGWGSEREWSDVAVADRLEDAVADKLGVHYVHAVNSGTSANEAAIASLGLAPGDEVICPAVSPVFVPFSILAAGCVPVFADVDPESLLVDANTIEAAISGGTRAAVVVHIWGMPAPMSSIMAMAERTGLKIVEDCAQGFGTKISGKPVGSFGDASCWSFQQSKHISCGEGGFFVSKSAEGYARGVLYSNAGIPNFRFNVDGFRPDNVAPEARGHVQFGHNHRISELQAAVAIAQLSRIEEFNRRRAELVKLVVAHLEQRGNTTLRVPAVLPDSKVSYWRYPILVPAGRGTFKGVSYLEPVFTQMHKERVTPFGVPIPEYVGYGRGECPGAELGVSQTRAVPIHHGLTDRELRDTLDLCLEGL